MLVGSSEIFKLLSLLLRAEGTLLLFYYFFTTKNLLFTTKNNTNAFPNPLPPFQSKARCL